MLCTICCTLAYLLRKTHTYLVLPLCCRWCEEVRHPKNSTLKFQLQEAVLNLRLIEGKVTHKTLHDFLSQQFDAWDIEYSEDNPIWLTTDKGSNIRKACVENARMRWAPCMSHVIQRAVFDLFKIVKKGNCYRKLVALSSLMHRSE